MFGKISADIYLTTMAFTVLAAVLTFAMLAIVVFPALRSRAEADVAERDFDITVYKDQLRELDADLERGTIDAAQADYARAEIGRRLLSADDAAEGKSGAGRKKTGAALIAASVLFVPAAAGLVYSMTGSPGMDSQPLASRVDERRQQIAQQTVQGLSAEQLIARAEAHLEQDPYDGRGWDVLAPLYLRLDRPGDARKAFERAIDILGETAARRSGLGQSLFMLSGGVVDGNARAAFDRALELDPSDGRALFFNALARAQADDVDGAIEQWQTLASDSLADPGWQAAAREGLRRFGGTAVASAPDATGPQPDEETIRDVQSMSPEEQQAMISNMVASLDARLRDEPNDFPGWQRLIRSYVVLDREADAQDAYERAVAAFSADETRKSELREFAEALGLSGETETR